MGTDPSLAYPLRRALGHVLGLDEAPQLADPDAADAADLRDQIGRTPEQPYVAYLRGRR